MKCPKCDYLGFETGDRCRNCGYDFSLIAGSPERVELDLDLHRKDQAAAPDWLAQVDAALQPAGPGTDSTLPESAPARSSPGTGAAPRETPSPVRATPAQRRAGPLFSSQVDEDGDEPLIQLPVAPRPPLAVRRTPETARRPMTTSPRRLEPGSTPPLLFEGAPAPAAEAPAIVGSRVTRVWDEPARRPVERLAGEDSTTRARAAAAAIDLLMLGLVDVVVVYLTLRMAGLTMDHWLALPAMPLAAFLLLIKLSYFSAFTAVGGQTIGKMATHIRVVSADDRPLDAASALRRTLVGLVSSIPLGVGFLPALLGADRRALHDRIARTRVIALRSA